MKKMYKLHLSLRALTMAGTFEEARVVYDKFYSLDFRKYGVDIPPRLDEMCEDKQTMLYAQQSLNQLDVISQDDNGGGKR
jgi:hypothetical protein